MGHALPSIIACSQTWTGHPGHLQVKRTGHPAWSWFDVTKVCVNLHLCHKNPQNMLHHKLEYYRHTKGTWFDVVRPLKDQGWYVMDSSICMHAHKRQYLGFSGLPCISQGVERFQNAIWNLNFGKSITWICNLHILEHCFEEQNLTARPHLPSCQFIAKCLMLLVNGWKAQCRSNSMLWNVVLISQNTYCSCS